MAECSTLEDVLRGCGKNIGSLKQAFYTFQSKVTGLTKNNTTGLITAITVAPSTTLNVIEFRKNQASFTEASAINLDNESSLFPITLGINHRRRDGGKSNALRKLAEGQPYLFFLVQDGNDKWWALENMQYSQQGGGSGATRADGSNYDMQFINEEAETPWEVDAAAVAAIV